MTTQVVRTTAETVTIGRALLAAKLDDLDAAASPADALAALDALDRAAAKVRERIVVGLVLDDGWTYAQVGRALGSTRQAARQRYGPAVAEQLRRDVRGRR